LNTGGSFTTIDVPGATQTEAFGINDSGPIVGSVLMAIMAVCRSLLGESGEAL
jgi:hypothetical protein